MVESPIIKQETWEDKGEELFGKDRENWEFICPACDNIASIKIAKEKYQELKGSEWSPPKECVGRYSDKVKCDWCSYSLFRGPLFVVAKGEEVAKDDYSNHHVTAVFDFNGKPFTEPQEENNEP